MISRCPSCGAQVPEDAKLCGACGWDFIARKKGVKPAAPADKKPSGPPKSPEPPPASGFSLPQARSLAEPPPGVEKPKDRPKSAPPPAPGDDNPFTLPAARKPLEPLVPLGLPPAKDPGKLEPTAALPPRGEPPKKDGLDIPARSGAESPSNPQEEKRKESDSQRRKKDEEIPLPPAREPDPAPEPDPEPGPAEPAEEIPEPVLALPTSPTDDPARRAARKEPETPASSPVGRKARPSPVYIAASAGAALGLVSVVAGFLLLKPEAPVNAPRASSPFGQRPEGEEALRLPSEEAPAPEVPIALAPLEPPAPATPPPAPAVAAPSPVPSPVPAPAPAAAPPAAGGPIAPPPSPAPVSTPAPPPPPAPALKPAPPPPAPKPAPVAAPAPKPAPPPKPARATADFSAAPKVTVGATKPAPPSAPAEEDAPAPVEAPKPARKPAAPKGPRWVFEGVAYDLLTTQGVFGAKLVFAGVDDETVGEVETNKDGRYKVSLPAGPAGGYTVRVVHDDYSAKPIEEMDSTSSLRNADLEQRKFLLSAGARSIPWIGSPTAPTKRDMALVPRAGAE